MTTLPDPRPQTTVGTDGRWCFTGSRCTVCSYRMLVRPPRCARCFGTLEEASFGPQGTVWSSTVVHIPVPGRTPPYTLAYVDIDEGPRVLAHVAGVAERLPVGTRVTLVAPSPEGDLMVEVVA